MADDLDLLMTAAARDGDAAAYAQVVEACHLLLRASILRDTADVELAEEIAQEALVRAWAKRDQYRPGTSPRAWLLTIARSQLIEHHRRQDRDRRHIRDLVHQELLRHRHEDDDDQGLARERTAALATCLHDLDPEQRHLLDLVHTQGLTTEAAAEVLGIRPATCRQRLSRLQRTLRDRAEALLRQQREA